MSRVSLRLVRRNLFKHPVRTLLTVGTLTVALFLLCVLRSFVVTLDAGVKSAKSNRLVVQSAVSLYVILPESYEVKIRSVEGVEAICPWTWFGGYYQDPSNFFAQFAVDEETLLDVHPEIVVEDGSVAEFKANRRNCLVGADIARDFNWKVGDSIPIISPMFVREDGQAWDFQVAGIYRSRTAAVDNRTIYFHDEYLFKSLEDGAARGPIGVGIYMVKVKDDVDLPVVMSRIDALFENGPQRVQSTTEAEFQAQFVSMLGNVPLFVSSIGGAVLLAILLAVVNTMLMAAREQVRDVGILKALGFGNDTIFVGLLCQSLFLSVLGGGLGVALAWASAGPVATSLGAMFPNYQVSPGTLALGATLSVSIGLFAGLAPAIQLSRLSCVESLRVEA